MKSSYQRILGVDYGSRRIGFSLSDPLGLIAQPIEAMKNDFSLFAGLKQLILREKVQLIVVGLPLNLKGQYTLQAEEVKKFIERLKKEINIEVVMWDERFTTTIAQQTMLTMVRKRKSGRRRMVA